MEKIMSSKDKMIVLVSGGVDSYVAFKFMEENAECPVFPLYIQYGSRYQNKEMEAVKRLYPKYLSIDTTSLNLSQYEVGEKAFILNRNIYLILIAANYGEKIVLGGLKDDRVGDKSPVAFSAIETMLNTVSPDKEFQIISPFWHMEKIDILKWYLDNKLPVEPLLETVSCYSLKPANYCGECPACFRKYCAFSYLGLPIPKFKNMELVERYVEEWKDKTSLRAVSICKAGQRLLNSQENIWMCCGGVLLTESERCPICGDTYND
jgi:7-cyano-7-deazaguanine synthase in queuosine biosynthesis